MEVWEEIPTMDYPFEGLPTIPPRKDMDHFGVFCDGARYRVKGNIQMTALDLKKILWNGGMGRGTYFEYHGGKRKIIASPEDIVLIFAGRQMADDVALEEYHVPPGSKCMLAIDRHILNNPRPDPDSSYWN